jgi:dipeptidyl aminopeptidase/acylaminoacyl peptidase
MRLCSMPDQPWLEKVCHQHRMLDLESLLRVPYVDPDGRFSIAPDGSGDCGATLVAFSWNLTGQWEIYLLSLDGCSAPRQVTRGEGGKLAPRWSPDGSRLAYVLDLDGGERYDICVYDLASGTHTNLTPETPFFIQPHLDWSPSNLQLAFASDHSGRFEAHWIPSTGGASHRMADLPGAAYAVHWSPDASWLAVTVLGHGPDFETYLAHPDTGQAFPLSHEGAPLSAGQAVWSPDGRTLAFESDLHGVYEIGLYELATGLFRWPTGGDGEKHAPAWSPDGRRLAFIHQWGATTSLVLLDLESGQQAFYQAGTGVHYAPAFTPDGKSVLFVFDSPGQPDDLWRLELASGNLQQLTFSLPDELKEAAFVSPEEVTYPSLDGQPVPALLYRPANAGERPPAVIDIHGGPNWLFQASWDPLVQHMLSRGWVVLAPNYRGSTGYGRSWQLANRFDLGGGDAEDVVAGMDFLLARGLADPLRIAVTGRSHGGYLTMTCLTRFPERWAGGSAVVPFLNWFTCGDESRPDLQQWDLENFGHPEKDYRRYYERSPLFFLDRVQAPVQLVCAANDPRCPASQSVQAWAALRAYSKACDFVLYPDEGHQFLKTKNVVDSKRRTVDFLAKVLEKGKQS